MNGYDWCSGTNHHPGDGTESGGGSEADRGVVDGRRRLHGHRTRADCRHRYGVGDESGQAREGRAPGHRQLDQQGAMGSRSSHSMPVLGWRMSRARSKTAFRPPAVRATASVPSPAPRVSGTFIRCAGKAPPLWRGCGIGSGPCRYRRRAASASCNNRCRGKPSAVMSGWRTKARMDGFVPSPTAWATDRTPRGPRRPR